MQHKEGIAFVVIPGCGDEAIESEDHICDEQETQGHRAGPAKTFLHNNRFKEGRFDGTWTLNQMHDNSSGHRPTSAQIIREILIQIYPSFNIWGEEQVILGNTSPPFAAEQNHALVAVMECWQLQSN